MKKITILLIIVVTMLSFGCGESVCDCDKLADIVCQGQDEDCKQKFNDFLADQEGASGKMTEKEKDYFCTMMLKHEQLDEWAKAVREKYLK